MTAHRITYVSNLDGKPSTKTFKTEKAAQEAWIGMTNSFVRYALWVELKRGDSGYDHIAGVRGEVHGQFYFGAQR